MYNRKLKSLYTRKSSCVNARGIPPAMLTHPSPPQLTHPSPPADPPLPPSWPTPSPLLTPPCWPTPPPQLTHPSPPGWPTPPPPCWPTPPPPPRQLDLTPPSGWTWRPPPLWTDRWMDGRTDACQNITFPRTTYAGGKNLMRNKHIHVHQFHLQEYYAHSS